MDKSLALSPPMSESAYGSASMPGPGSLVDHKSASSLQDHDPTDRVGGYLGTVQQDLAIQSVTPYTGVEDELRAFMSREPNPTDTRTSEEPFWIDVCATVIADTRSGSVKRIQLRRLVEVEAISRPPKKTQNPSVYSFQRTHLHILQEEFTEEPIAEPDSILLRAVERLGLHSGHASRSPSAAPSRSPSPRPDLGDKLSGSLRPNYADRKVPRDACKTIIFDALEQVVKDCVAGVVDGLKAGNISADNGSGSPSILRRHLSRRLANVADKA